MRTLIYDLLQLMGVGLVASGAWMEWGAPYGLMSAGALVLWLSLVDATMATSPRREREG